MSLITAAQKEYILDKRAQRSFLSGDFVTFNTTLDAKIILGKPSASLYKAVPYENIDNKKLKDYVTSIELDTNIAITAYNNLTKNTNQSYQLILNKMSLSMKRVEQYRKTSEFLTSISQGYASWAHLQTFYNTNWLDLEETNSIIDSELQAAYIPYSLVHTEALDFNNYYINLENCTVFGVRNNVFTGAKFLASGKDSKIKATIDIKETNVTEIVINPVGNTHIKIQLLREGNWHSVVNAVTKIKGSYPVLIQQATKMLVELSPVEDTLNSVFGTESIELVALRYNDESLVVSTSFTPSSKFSSYKVSYEADVPQGTYVIPYVKIDSGAWVKVKPDAWTVNTTPETTEYPITVASLEPNGLYYYTNTFDNISNSREGTLTIGRDQVEISTIKKIPTDEGSFYPDLHPGLFKDAGSLVCWETISSVDQLSTSSESVEVQLVPYGDEHTSLTKDNQLFIGEQDSEFQYTSLSILPLHNGQSSAARENYIYKIQYKFFANKDSVIDFGKYWFLQGHRTPSTRTFQQLGLSYGIFSVYINDIRVCSSQSPFTLYTDGSSQSGASVGTNWSFMINKGWNTFELYFYCPELPAIANDANSTTEKYLQLTLYPNILDTEFKRLYEVTDIVGTGTFDPVSEFDLGFNLPKSFKYWAWKDTGYPNKIALNKNSSDIIDGFIGSKLSNQPNLSVKYSGFNSSITDLVNTTTIDYKFELRTNQSNTLTPKLRSVKILTK